MVPRHPGAYTCTRRHSERPWRSVHRSNESRWRHHQSTITAATRTVTMARVHQDSDAARAVTRTSAVTVDGQRHTLRTTHTSTVTTSTAGRTGDSTPSSHLGNGTHYGSRGRATSSGTRISPFTAPHRVSPENPTRARHGVVDYLSLLFTSVRQSSGVEQHEGVDYRVIGVRSSGSPRPGRTWNVGEGASVRSLPQVVPTERLPW